MADAVTQTDRRADTYRFNHFIANIRDFQLSHFRLEFDARLDSNNNKKTQYKVSDANNITTIRHSHMRTWHSIDHGYASK
jgi:hypothetical protein